MMIKDVADLPVYSTQTMKDTCFSMTCPPHYTPDFNACLYNQPRFLSLKHDDSLLSYYIIDRKRYLVLAAIYFLIADNQAISMIKAPFGGLETSGKLPLEALNEFIAYFTEDLSARNIEKITICEPAPIYKLSQGARVCMGFCNNGYAITSSAMNHHLVVDTHPFESKIHLMQRRKLKKSGKKHFSFVEESPDKLRLIYEFILSCRRERQASLSMTYPVLEEAVNSLPDCYRLFAVYHAGTLIAATVTVKVTEKVLYHFYPGSLQAYKAYSPMVFLVKKLYEFCFSHGFEVLDLGTSMLDGAPHYSLIQFKERIGGQASLKHTLQWTK